MHLSKVIVGVAFLFCSAMTERATTHSVVLQNVFEVDSTSLSVRSGPGSGYQVIGSLTKGQRVTVVRLVNEDWAEIDKGKFVNSTYLRQAIDVTTLPHRLVKSGPKFSPMQRPVQSKVVDIRRVAFALSVLTLLACLSYVAFGIARRRREIFGFRRLKVAAVTSNVIQETSVMQRSFVDQWQNVPAVPCAEIPAVRQSVKAGPPKAAVKSKEVGPKSVSQPESLPAATPDWSRLLCLRLVYHFQQHGSVARKEVTAALASITDEGERATQMEAMSQMLAPYGIAFDGPSRLSYGLSVGEVITGSRSVSSDLVGECLRRIDPRLCEFDFISKGDLEFVSGCPDETLTEILSLTDFKLAVALLCMMPATRAATLISMVDAAVAPKLLDALPATIQKVNLQDCQEALRALRIARPLSGKGRWRQAADRHLSELHRYLSPDRQSYLQTPKTKRMSVQSNEPEVDLALDFVPVIDLGLSDGASQSEALPKPPIS